jgi:hypothetical protein
LATEGRYRCVVEVIVGVTVITGHLVTQVLGDQLDEHLADKTRFARSRHAGDCCQDALWEGDLQVVEVVASDTGEA